MTVSLVAREARRCAQSAVHVAPTGGAGFFDGRRQRRRGRCCFGVSSSANQVRELHRLLGKKTLEAEILKEALEHATGSKKQLRLPPSPQKESPR
jgi:nicotinamide mononucleotide (NMN) deamidase PncC